MSGTGTGPEGSSTGVSGPFFVLTALALAVGWGIRGNFGHEFGAMIPGALAATAVAVLSGRDDWRRRSAYFAALGALGWSFGGSISYMQVIAYTHSGHSPSVLYGFAGLFLIGFLWAAPGGAGTALAAFADRERLTGLFVPISAVFVTWAVQGVAVDPWLAARGYHLDWYDTDWPGALTAPLAVLALAAIRRRVDWGTGLVLAMSGGWWLGFLVLVNLLGLRMTPPRGDNWAGCLGMTVSLLVYLARTGLAPVARAALVCGFAGGVGFAAASMLKLVEVISGFETNWHSILEQTTGLFNGLALAAAMARPAREAPRLVDDPPLRRWTEVYAAGFVLVGVTYLNLRKNPAEWVRVGAVPPEMAGLPAGVWFGLGYLAISVAVLVPMARHLRHPLALIPADPLGRGQLLFLVFLWWVVVGNFERALVQFTAVRLVTEGVILLNASACTLLVLLAVGRDPGGSSPPTRQGGAEFSIGSARPRFGRLIAAGLAAATASVLLDWGIVRAVHGDRFAGHAGHHVRFGPGATLSKPGTPPPAPASQPLADPPSSRGAPSKPSR